MLKRTVVARILSFIRSDATAVRSVSSKMDRICETSTSAAAPMCSDATEKVVEVEKRFPFSVDTEAKLIEAGAFFLSEKSFTDTYLDTKDYRLTGADHWLRRREGAWQLKYPSPVQMSKNAAAEYVECDKEETILEIIKSVISKNANPDIPQNSEGHEGSSCEETLSSLSCLGDICSFETRRKKFSLDGIIIDLDSMCFDFRIGEMEVLVKTTGNHKDDREKHRQALEAIDNVASKLGITLATTRSEGKVSNFLRRYRKDHYDYLRQKGVIRA